MNRLFSAEQSTREFGDGDFVSRVWGFDTFWYHWSLSNPKTFLLEPAKSSSPINGKHELPMLTSAKYVSALSVWAASLFGTLQMHGLDLGLGHRICGRWGCGPTVEALLGYHGFWMLLIVPIALLGGLVLSNSKRRSLGWWMMVGGILGALVYMVYDGVLYYGRVHSTQFAVQRAFFAVAVAVDLPMLQVAFAGLCLRSGWFDKPDSPDPADAPEHQIG